MNANFIAEGRKLEKSSFKQSLVTEIHLAALMIPGNFLQHTNIIERSIIYACIYVCICVCVCIYEYIYIVFNLKIYFKSIKC